MSAQTLEAPIRTPVQRLAQIGDPATYVWRTARALLPGTDDQVQRALTNPVVRRTLAEVDPLLFALLYLPHHLRGEETANEVSLSEFHIDLIDRMRDWVGKTSEPAGDRHGFIAPRGCGKSTWAFLVMPLWFAAFDRMRFVAAFSDTATQAETHLTTLKRELDTNVLLRADFPDLCAPALRPSGVKVSDNRSLVQTKSGFAFAAKGIDSGMLGLKVGSVRPDLLIFDDVEPGEANYSAYLMRKRRTTIIDDVLGASVNARVVFVGTTTMTGSLMHQLVQAGRGEQPEQWIRDEHIQVHYWPAILKNDDGSERSIWPAKWSMDYLRSIRHTRAFAKNMLNLPVPSSSAYWQEGDFHVATLAATTRTVLSIDPAVTVSDTSDYTALAVVAMSPSEQRMEVRRALQVRLRGAPLRSYVLGLLAQDPSITLLLVEQNQGGQTWLDLLHDMPVPIQLVHQSEAKEVRAARLLGHYQLGRIVHQEPLSDLQAQMLEFPNALHDDLLDAVGTAVDHLSGHRTGKVKHAGRASVRAV